MMYSRYVQFRDIKRSYQTMEKSFVFCKSDQYFLFELKKVHTITFIIRKNRGNKKECKMMNYNFNIKSLIYIKNGILTK